MKVWEAKLKDVLGEVSRLERKNEKMDRIITRMNVDRCDMELERDHEGETRQKDYREKIFKLTAERSAVVRKLLANYEELLELRKLQEESACSKGKPIPIDSVEE